MMALSLSIFSPRTKHDAVATKKTKKNLGARDGGSGSSVTAVDMQAPESTGPLRQTSAPRDGSVVSEAQELSSTTRRVGAVVDTESAQGPLDPFACRALRLSASPSR
jgi:hypothetical protein